MSPEPRDESLPANDNDLSEADYLDESDFGEISDPREEEITALKEEVGKLKDQLLRTLADMDNLRKRSERERAEATLYAATNFARDILSVSDNLSRALELAHADAL